MVYLRIRNAGNGQPSTCEFDHGEIITANSQRRYRLGRHYINGGNGSIFHAERMDTHEKFGIKMLTNLDRHHVDRFENEVRIWKELNHEQIIKLEDYGVIRVEDSQVPWAACRLCAMNLRHYIEGESGGNFPRVPSGRVIIGKDFRRIARQMVTAMEHLHICKIIHRDIKPANFVVEKRAGLSVYMIDFGIAKYIGEDVSSRPMDTFTRTSEFVGPQNWASPELVNYARNKTVIVDQRSDIYQMGKLLWYIATRQYTGGAPSSRACPFRGGLAELVRRMCVDEPSERPSSAKEILEAIDGF